MNHSNTVALLGATGKAGQYILKKLLEQGYRVRALIRQPDTFTMPHPLLEIVPGDVIDTGIAHMLVKNSSAVVMAIGPKKNEPLISRLATANVLVAMEAEGIKRVIMLAGLNVNVPGDKKSAENIAKSDWMRQMFPEAVADRQKAYELLTESNTAWTMLRLPWIEQTNETRGIIVDLYDSPGEKVSTTDLADFVIEQIEDNTYFGKAPFLASL